MTCLVKDCDVEEAEKPMCFRGMLWCSDDHRKIVTGEWEGELKDVTE